MRWESKEPKPGDARYRWTFPLRPKKYFGWWYWWEWVLVKEKYWYSMYTGIGGWLVVKVCQMEGE